MNFDIKDVKSWANRHDVKTLSVTGFFGNSVSEIDDEIKRYNNGEKDRLHELYQISDNGCYCFGYALYYADTGAFGGTNNFAFFLPLNAVKEDKPKEKKYRPFKNKEEIYDYLNFDFLVGHSLCFRNRNDPNIIKTILIVSAEYNNHILIRINGYDLKWWFDNYECKVTGKWLPFGVEVEEDEN